MVATPTIYDSGATVGAVDDTAATHVGCLAEKVDADLTPDYLVTLHITGSSGVALCLDCECNSCSALTLGLLTNSANTFKGRLPVLCRLSVIDTRYIIELVTELALGCLG